MDGCRGKTLLLIDGSALAIPAVRRARALGIRTVVANYYDARRAPAKAEADAAFDVDFSDIEAMAALCRREGVDGMLQGWTDSHLNVYADLCARMQWPCYGTKRQFEIFTHKDLLKAACRAYGVPVSEEYSVCLDSAGSPLPPACYPLVVKPVDGSGSRGVAVCRNEAELRLAYRQAQALSPTGSALAERYITGEHVNIYYTICNGEAYLSAMADRYVDPLDGKGAPIPVCLVHPSRYLADYEKTVDGAVRRMFAGLGLQNGLVFVQGFRCADGAFVVYEMGYRLNGGATYALINRCSGYDQLDMMIRFALLGDMGGRQALARQTPHFSRLAVTDVLSTAGGVIAPHGVRGLERVRALPQVVDVVQTRFGGESLGPGCQSQIVAYVLFMADDAAQANATMREIRRLVTVYGEDGGVMPMRAVAVVE